MGYCIISVNIVDIVLHSLGSYVRSVTILWKLQRTIMSLAKRKVTENDKRGM